MKFTKLLVLGTFWLAGVGSALAVDGNVWTKPVPSEFAAMKDSATYYFYNVGSQLFFTEGNAWGTQASVGTTGLKVKIESTTAEGVYTLTDYTNAKSAWLKWWFIDNADDPTMYVDYNGQDNYLWKIADMGDNVYRFGPHTNNPFAFDDDVWVGLDRSTEDTRTYLTWNNKPDGPAFIDWKLVTEEVYDAYKVLVPVYDAAMALKAVLDEAEAIGANVADQLAVYMNTASTEDELKAATEAAKQAVEQRKLELIEQEYENATADKPVDVTSKFLKNYDFAGQTSANWSGTAFGFVNAKQNGEHYAKTYNTYQTAKGLKAGVYALGVNAFYRAGNADPAYQNYKAQNEESRYAQFYATVGNETSSVAIVSPFTAGLTEKTGKGSESEVKDNGVSHWIPNNMEAAEYYMHTLGKYANKLFVSFDEDGDLTIGVKKEKTIGGDWSIFDDFSLVYYGKGADAYQKWVDEMIAFAYPDFILADDALYTQDYIDAYEEVRQGRTATNKAEVETVLAEVAAAKAAVEKNLSLWQEYVKVMDEAKELANNQTYASQAEAEIESGTEFANAYYDMLEYYEEEYPIIKDAQTMMNDELEAEVAKAQGLVKAFLEAVKNDIKPGDDVTRFLVNADFENGGNGWQGGSSITAFNAGCAEAYEKNPFDLYQTVQGLKPGVYSISLQGFYRLGANDAAYSAWKSAKAAGKPQDPVAWVYLNQNSTPLNNVFDIEGEIKNNSFFDTNLIGPAAYQGITAAGDTCYFPNGMSTSHDCFEAGYYKKSAFGLIRSGEEMRIGIKGALGGSQWAIWDNFKLTYEGYEFTTIKPLLEEAMTEINAQLKAIDEQAAEGEQSLGKSIRANVNTALAAGAAALESEDGEAAFKALGDIVALKEGITESAALFVKLQDALGQFESTLDNAVNEAYKAECQLWYLEVMDKMGSGDLENADAEDIIAEIAVRSKKLAQPDPDMVDDDNAVDVTSVIVNPGNDTNTGWSGTAAAYSESCAEIFGKNFDFYQDIEGLNEGTYEVRVQGFYRAGSAANDYKTFTEAPDHKNYACFYAVGKDSLVSSKAIARLASGAVEGDSLSLPSGYTFAVAPDSVNLTGYYVANSMATAQIEFTNGNYKNEGLFVKVGEDGKLRIGIKKEVDLADNWTIWDSWQLIYYGKNSANEATPDNFLAIANVAEGVKVKVEYFTIDGRKAMRAQKGIFIEKTTLENGNVIVKKVRR